MGWFFGFQRPLRVNAEGELLAWRVTPAEGDDKVPLHRMPTGLWGHLFGDCGDLSRAIHQALGAQGLGVIPLRRRNMKPRLRRVWDRRRLRQRFLREPLNDQVKNLSQIEHSRHCRLRGFRGHLVGGLMAYTFQPTKPSVGLRYGASVLPVVM